MKLHAFLIPALVLSGPASAAIQYINLGGPATGYLAVSNFKNSTSQNGIEGKNSSGEPVAGHNGLPDYPNYLIPESHDNPGRWTAIIASPQYSGADYSPLYAHSGVNPGDVTVNNLTVSDANHATMSAGLIGFDNSLLTGSGLETIPVNALIFNFDTYLWDGKTQNNWTVFSTPTYISSFSPVYTEYNDANGAGNAALIYNLSLSNVAGTGLTFVDGQLVSMDIDATLNVLARAGYIPNPSPFQGATFTGTFTASGMNYAFDLDSYQSAAVFSAIHMVMNREGTASLIPEPSAATLGALATFLLFRRRRQP